ncbi:heme-binding protein 2-like [Melanotaenia boesemani]|nr:heme-binding protein 2-like [Melanotaenia boesemani]
MKQLLFSVLVLVLVSLCSGQAAVCRQQPCPEYQTVDTNEDFEERRYVASDWITTKVDSTSDIDMVAASNRLKAYCQSLKEAGHEMPDSWPVLITVREGEDALDLSLSWFVPPGVKAGITDASVTLQHKDAATVYVRAFSGTPSLSSGQENVQILREALVKAGKSFDLRIFVGVGYEPYYSLIHHNEVWIYAA